jgi:tetratricopeptide (TPR) repeat protein
MTASRTPLTDRVTIFEMRADNPAPRIGDSPAFRRASVVRALLVRAKSMTGKPLAPRTTRSYSWFTARPAMRTALLAALLFTAAASTLAADARGDAQKLVKFGIEVARYNLWREAAIRFERATDIDPDYAAAWNNLAIAYEHQGELPKALRAYERALKLDSGNQYIKQNYELFREINDRASRQRNR